MASGCMHDIVWHPSQLLSRSDAYESQPDRFFCSILTESASHTKMSRGYCDWSRGFSGANSSRRATGRDGSKSVIPELNDLAQEEPGGELLASVDEHAVKSIITHPRIEDCEYVASYNWVDRGTPTILVPG